MERLKHNIIATVIIFFIPLIAFANTYGVALSSPINIHASDPDDIGGGQIMLTYDPARFQWRHFNIHFDGGYTYFHSPHVHHHSNISILSVAPVIRHRYKQRGPIQPYLDLSIGLSYLSKTRFEWHDLGMHFAFQDRIGAGILFGERHQFTLGMSAIHYSNAHLSRHNPGISVPLMINASYSFA